MTKWYDNLPWILRLIMAIFLGYPLAIVIRVLRFVDSKETMTLVGAILAIPFGFVFWLVDLITTIIGLGITVLAK